MNDQERILLALQCRDCDSIPRVADAGAVIEDPAGARQVMHNGLRLFCDSHYGGYNVEVIRQLRGHHEPQEEAVFHEVLKRIPEGGTILELGAFWGYYSLWFTAAVPRGEAILVEPVPAFLESGKRNFALNGAEGRFVHAAVGSEPRALAEVELWRGMTVEVGVQSVDSLFEAEGISRVDILHADIQGHEVAMLRGARGVMERRGIGWFVISTHGENIHQRCLQLLRGAGYHIAAEHTPGESFSVDGLIVASADRVDLSAKFTRRGGWAARKARWRATVRVRVLEPLGLKPVTT